jgi:predicted membrane-bound spermidine synthase
MNAHTHSRTAAPGAVLLLLLAFTEGAAVMVAQLAGAKMLAPLYGSSLYVWGSTIGITLISLTSGYYLGGLLSYRVRRRELIYWFMLIAASLVVLMPTIAHSVITTFRGLETIRAILLVTSIYLLPPLLLLGATSPLIISVLATEVRDSGSAAGRVYAVSTVGGIVGTFGAGFWLIPVFGLTHTAHAAGILLAILPLAMLLKSRHWPAVAFPVLLLFLLPRGEPFDHPDVRLLYESEGLLGQLQVVDVTFRDHAGQVLSNDRILFVNRTGQTWVDRDSGEPAWEYMRVLTTVGSLLPEGSRALVLGLGGGVVARELQGVGLVVDSVELDARIARIARNFFGFQPNGEVIINDGRHFVRSTARRYDLIILDVYQAEVPPAHMLTLEAFKEMRELLNPDGLLVLNYSGFITGSAGRGARSIVRTLVEAGYRVQLLATHPEENVGNNLMIATDGPLDMSAPRVPLVADGRPRPLSDLLVDTAGLAMDDALILLDNRPILEKLNLEAAARWRQDYYEMFTSRFIELGIPLFH